jgi:protein O-GlcNAc transferase
MAGSLLRALDLPELITQRPQEYLERAIQLARQPEELTQLRRRLVANRKTHPVFNTERFCRHLERAYSGMWQRYQRGEPPASFTVAPIDMSAAVQ